MTGGNPATRRNNTARERGRAREGHRDFTLMRYVSVLVSRAHAGRHVKPQSRNWSAVAEAEKLINLPHAAKRVEGFAATVSGSQSSCQRLPLPLPLPLTVRFRINLASSCFAFGSMSSFQLPFNQLWVQTTHKIYSWQFMGPLQFAKFAS